MDTILTNALIFTSAFALSSAIVYLMIRLCEVMSLYDNPDERKIHTGKIGRLGGVGVITAFVTVGTFTLGRYYSFNVSLPLLAAGLLTVFAMGLVDDVKPIRARYKLAVQILAAALAVSSGLRIHAGHYISSIQGVSEVIDIAVTVIWILAFMNAVNLIDGLDGLSSGLTMIGLVFFAVVGAMSGNPFLMTSSLILLGSILGFFVFNRPPARIFLGDAGAYSIGYIVSVIIPLTSGSDAGSRTIIVPVMIFLFPFIDVGRVIIRRLQMKRPIFEADRNHIHHKLLEAGYSNTMILATVFPIAILFGSFGALYWHGGFYSRSMLLLTVLVVQVHFLYWLSVMEDRTERLAAIIDPRIRWWEQTVRYYPRGVAVEFRTLNDRKLHIKGGLQEISPDGLQFFTNVPVQEGDSLQLKLRLGGKKTVNLKGEVLYLTSRQGKYQYGFWCHFTNAGFIRRRVLSMYLKSVSAEVKRNTGSIISISTAAKKMRELNVRRNRKRGGLFGLIAK